MPSGFAVTSESQRIVEGIDTFLANTHRAWQTKTIPGCVFPEQRNLSRSDFLGVYRGEGLISFCAQFAPILPGEFLLAYFYNPAIFKSHRKLHFCLTNERFVIWDTKRKKYLAEPLSSCLTFSPKRNYWFLLKEDCFFLKMKDGSTEEIHIDVDSLDLKKSTIAVINAAFVWASSPGREIPSERSGPEEQAEVQTQKIVPAKNPAISLKQIYASRWAAGAVSPTAILVLVIIFAEGGSVIIPGFFGILLMGLIGFASGYAYGAYVESAVRRRAARDERERQRTPI